MAHVRSHYDRQAQEPILNGREAHRRRKATRTAALKIFHNEVKSRMIKRFSTDAAHHVDFACGR